MAGTAYRGDHPGFGSAAQPGKASGETRLTPYPTGTRVEVRYDPTDRTRGVLEPGAPNLRNRCWQRRGERCFVFGLTRVAGAIGGGGWNSGNDGRFASGRTSPKTSQSASPGDLSNQGQTSRSLLRRGSPGPASNSRAVRFADCSSFKPSEHLAGCPTGCPRCVRDQALFRLQSTTIWVSSR